MSEPTEARVAVYVDFDNIVISRYNQLHGPRQFQTDKVRGFSQSHAHADTTIAARIIEATIDISSLLDYASSFGAIVSCRAYADWSATVNSRYREQLIARAVDLTQLFPTAGGRSNGADIRLCVDVMEDLFRLEDLSHVVIVAGDSDYIPLAQRCKRLGRFVVGVGVGGATATSLIAACDEFSLYGDLPGLATPQPNQSGRAEPAAATSDGNPVIAGDLTPPVLESAAAGVSLEAEPGVLGAQMDESLTPGVPVTEEPHQAASELLVRAARLVLTKSDSDKLFAASVKAQMKRIDPSFNERALGFGTFTDFVRSRRELVELNEESPYSGRTLRLLV